jgi:hypothetical protein
MNEKTSDRESNDDTAPDIASPRPRRTGSSLDQMWATGSITRAGADDVGTARGGDGTVGWDFCPGDMHSTGATCNGPTG